MKHDLLARGASATLTDWLLARHDRFTDQGRLLRWQLRYQSFWFERLLKSQTHLGPTLSAEPLFVLGFWRSGTTLLHNMLFSQTQCRAPLTWECFNPATFALQTAPKGDTIVQRPMDSGLIHLLGPQEDEFAALLLGEPSLYRGFLDPEALEALGAQLSPSRVEPLERWRHFVAQVGADGSNPVLLKSPNHIFRIATLRRWYPAMRAVWIARAFEDVLHSNISMWTAMIERHALTRFDPSVLTPFLASVADTYADVLGQLLDDGSADVLWLDYHQITRDTAATTAAASRFLGLTQRPFAAQRTTVDTVVRPSLRNRNPDALPPVLARAAERIDSLHRHAKVRFGQR